EDGKMNSDAVGEAGDEILDFFLRMSSWHAVPSIGIAKRRHKLGKALDSGFDAAHAFAHPGANKRRLTRPVHTLECIRLGIELQHRTQPSMLEAEATAEQCERDDVGCFETVITWGQRDLNAGPAPIAGVIL